MLENNIRFAPPSKFVKSPYGTIVKVFTNNDDIEIYIQLSREITKPVWSRLGDFLESLLNKHLANTAFIKTCLNLYETKQQIHFNTLNKIIKTI